ncbi:MAG: hypothetical protein II723_03890 [Oscillospiraceae bacterium]|nr:hypothetical protein [Oscillospiraceae bacterium]
MNSLLSDLRRAVRSLPFLCAAVLQLLILRYGGFESELYRMSVPLVCTFPFSCAWLDESRSGFTRLALHRTTVFRYIAGKHTACALSGGLCELLPAALFCTWNRTPLPENLRMIFWCAAFWAGLSALLAAASESKYSAYGGAFVICYFLVILHERYWKACHYLDPFEWLSPKKIWPLEQDGAALMLGSMTLLTGLLYACILERRISHG